MKKVTVFLLAAVMALTVLTGCGGNENATTGGNDTKPAATTEKATDNKDTQKDTESETPVRKDIKIAMDADPGTFNPYATASMAFGKVNKLVYQALTIVNSENEYIPVLAESIEQVDDLTYKVKIKENIYDSAGNHITAEDVVFSCQQHKDSNRFATWKYSNPDKPFEQTGEYEVTFYYVQPTVNAFDAMSAQVMIVSKKSYEESEDQFTNDPIGTGPYVLDKWVVGNEFTFVKNENYWDDNPVEYYVQNMDSITFKVIAEKAQRAIELETHGVDFIYDPQVSDMKRFEDNPEISPIRFSGTAAHNIYFNCSETSKCKDVRMRQAVAYALDSVGATLAATEGLGTPAASYAHPSTKEWRAAYEGRILYPQDLDKAKELVAAMAADGVPLEFSIITDESSVKVLLAQIIQESCKNVGITVTVEQLETAVFQARYADFTQWDAYMGQSGYSGYTSAIMSTMIERTGYPKPSPLRDAIVKAFERYDADAADAAVALWEEELPILPIAYVDKAAAADINLTNILLDTQGNLYPNAASWEK